MCQIVFALFQVFISWTVPFCVFYEHNRLNEWLIYYLFFSGTHKLKKVDLAKEGFNPNIIKDNLYYMNSKTQQYEPLTVQVYNDICSGKIRL